MMRESAWIARPKWAESKGIRSFARQPLIFRGEIMGVLAIDGKWGGSAVDVLIAAQPGRAYTLAGVQAAMSKNGTQNGKG
jgi:hypothetical protein